MKDNVDFSFLEGQDDDLIEMVWDEFMNEKVNHILHGDCLEEMKKILDESVDSIVTDPPYGLSFMNKKWDYDVPSVEVFEEMLRIAKPGTHLVCFGGTRTYHRIACNIEDAGWEIKDSLMWVFGSGFPKNMNIKKLKKN